MVSAGWGQLRVSADEVAMVANRGASLDSRARCIEGEMNRRDFRGCVALKKAPPANRMLFDDITAGERMCVVFRIDARSPAAGCIGN